MSYATFLRDYVALPARAAAVFQQRPVDFFAFGADGVTVGVARAMGLPGVAHLGLAFLDPVSQAELDEAYRYHFPDGNASIARLRVARLLPGVVDRPVRTMVDVVLVRCDHGALDRAGQDVRLRLSSTVMRVEHPEAPVGVGYLGVAGVLHRIEARQVVQAALDHGPTAARRLR
ncbi:MAG: hypothetical protein FJ137_02145 [Deltaproteobacteria bacterium]|nr:hypothetical protein [Deltaproteobacteria bacterium]